VVDARHFRPLGQGTNTILAAQVIGQFHTGTVPFRELANLGGDALRPAPVGAYPAGASAYGAEQLMGDVWEWTSSDFQPWPGFRPMLYADYSAPFFGGDYRVLRGGSWAVGASILRPSFRNWDHPIRRQVFSGFRLAWSVDEPAA